MGVANAIPTPTPKPNTDTDTEPDELVSWHQTEQQFVSRARLEQLGCGLLPGTRANNRRVLRLFLTDQLAGPGN